jgi:uncharacterized protein (DUF302 family)
MSYYFGKTLDAGFDETVARTREALAAEGFGVLTEIDVAKTLHAKLGVDFRPLPDPGRLQSEDGVRSATA